VNRVFAGFFLLQGRQPVTKLCNISLESSSNVQSSHLTAYQEDGFVIVRGLVPSDLARQVADQADRLLGDSSVIDADNLRCRFKIRPGDGAQVLDAIDPVMDLLPVVREIAESSSLNAVLTEIYGESPRLFKDKLILKPPGSPGYPWHQDYISWPFFPESFVTVMVALDEARSDNGCLEIVRGSHKRGYLSPRDGDFHDLPEAGLTAEDRIKTPLSPGDAVIFGCYTVHGSGPNRSTSPRRQLYLSYNKDSDGGDQRTAHYRYFHAWLRRRYEEYGAKQAFFR